MLVTFLKDWACYFLLMLSAYFFAGTIYAISYFPEITEGYGLQSVVIIICSFMYGFMYGFSQHLGLHSVIIFVYSFICGVINIQLRKKKRDEFCFYLTSFFYFCFYVTMFGLFRFYNESFAVTLF